ncbi:MAG TPA: sigma-70 family RNA polymerase sigma factor [Blastocatellia bacterium]
MVSNVISADLFEADRPLLWGLCYRMTGCAADADDLVQETFVKALEDPPPDLDRPLRPWLVRVALNLSRDFLRRRKRREYTGPWLPSPVPTEESQVIGSYEPRQPDEASPAARYEMLETISFAFLLALEALTPAQRAVLLLRDVFDYSTAETAAALNITVASAKVLLHRARGKMHEYGKNHSRPIAEKSEETRKALEQFLLYFRERNIEALERLFKEDSIAVTDGGGEVLAARNIIVGRRNVLRLLFGLSDKAKSAPLISFHSYNGLPALLIEQVDPLPNTGVRTTLHVQVDDFGWIDRVDIVTAPSKLTALGKVFS